MRAFQLIALSGKAQTCYPKHLQTFCADIDHCIFTLVHRISARTAIDVLFPHPCLYDRKFTNLSRPLSATLFPWIPYAENPSANVSYEHECVPLFCTGYFRSGGAQLPQLPYQLILRCEEISAMLTIGSSKLSGIFLCCFTLVHPVFGSFSFPSFHNTPISASIRLQAKGDTAKCFGRQK